MSTPWIDFQTLRERLDFAEVLRDYGIELRLRGGNRHQGFCPLPGHEGRRRSPSFSAHLDRKVFHCFGCGRKGNCIDFIAYMQGLDPRDPKAIREAAVVAAERFGITSEAPPPAERRERPAGTKGDAHGSHSKAAAQKSAERAATRPAIVNAPLDFELKALDAEHPYLRERGFTPETIAHFGVGYCARGLMQGRIVFPLHNAAGKLVGYAGRLVDDAAIDAEHPKYRFPGPRERDGERHEFHKSLFLYNGFAVGTVADLVVVEGFASVLWLWQHGFANAVATMGAEVSNVQLRLLVEATRPEGTVWIMPDADPAGERFAENLLRELSPHRRVRWVKLEAGEQPTDCTLEELSGLLPPGGGTGGVP